VVSTTVTSGRQNGRGRGQYQLRDERSDVGPKRRIAGDVKLDRFGELAVVVEGREELGHLGRRDARVRDVQIAQRRREESQRDQVLCLLCTQARCAVSPSRRSLGRRVVGDGTLGDWIVRHVEAPDAASLVLDVLADLWVIATTTALSISPQLVYACKSNG
jgi:hypothetical protein